MHRDEVCSHASPVVVSPVEEGGWLARCLRCGTLGRVGNNSIEALDLLQHSRDMRPSGAAWHSRGMHNGPGRHGED